MNIKQKKQTIIFGFHPVLELLRAKKRKICTLFITDPAPKKWSRIAPLIQKSITKVYTVSRQKLTSLAQSDDHQGIVALTTPFIFRAKQFCPKKQPFIVLLDRIQDPRNVGAIIRSSFCTGVDGIIITEKHSASLTPTAIKASAGLAELMSIKIYPSAQKALNDLMPAGYILYTATLQGEPLQTASFAGPTCIIIGNEQNGIASDIIKQTNPITIPQRIASSSYNASVAAGIILYTAGIALKKI